MQRSAHSTLPACLLLLALSACQSRAAEAPALVQETKAQTTPNNAPAARDPGPTTSAGIDPRLPVVGDPLGLLSKSKTAPAMPTAGAKPGAAHLDPAALMANIQVEHPTEVPPERDPRAIARGQAGAVDRTLAPSSKPASGSVQVQEKSAKEIVRRATQGGARAHVLLLYASYCKACRHVMPSFVQLVRSYKSKGVAFTAASLDEDPEAFAAYAAVLEGTMEPFWIRSQGPGTTRIELTRAGIVLPDNMLSIPLFAVFAGQNRLVAQGHSSELRNLPRTLDTLL